MKYIKIEFFEKHLDQALPEHFSRVYFLFLEDPGERLFLAKQIAQKLGLRPFYSAASSLIEEMHGSLFSEKKVLICDEPTCEEIPKVDDLILIFTGKKPPPFYKKMEKEGTTLDLSEEKPWDRKRRLQRWLVEWAQKQSKSLGAQEALHLVDAFSTNFGRLFQELEKVIVYSGEEKRLTLESLKEVCFLKSASNGWQISEVIVLGGDFDSSTPLFDLSTLIGQIRYHLQVGLEITAERNRLNISRKKIEKFRETGLSFSYFLESLQDLLNLEIKMRLTPSSSLLLFDQFRAKLENRRKDSPLFLY